VLLSGGLDSATVLAIARSEGYDVTALIFRYGQRHAIETELAAAMASSLGVPSRVQDLDLSAIGASALTSSALEVPTDRSEAEMSTGVPVTYVPARNTIFLAYALAWAEVLRAPEIFIGVNALDYSGYPDCRPEYIAAFERLADLATRASTEEGVRFRIHTPLLHKTKAEIIAWGVRLGVDYSRTWSCYAPVLRPGAPPLACGRCDSCLLRKKGFREAGVEDPTGYAGG
jgi:7-cyano-7-deazaguanine synthase